MTKETDELNDIFPSDAYSFNQQTSRLIELFRSGPPDFAATEELIRLGANINERGNTYSINPLAEILGGYWQSGINSENNKECEYCENSFAKCPTCRFNINPEAGKNMLRIIRFFLDHGFDVSKDSGKYGAACLYELKTSSFDDNIIEATKLIKNMTIHAT